MGKVYYECLPPPKKALAFPPLPPSGRGGGGSFPFLLAAGVGGAEVITACEKGRRWKAALDLMEDMRQMGYDFYEVPLLDSLFKRLVAALANRKQQQQQLEGGKIEEVAAWQQRKGRSAGAIGLTSDAEDEDIII
uniref:Uncharacterized protein n=1 Tax=Heterosigma akashiwo TaxID=2829 RepID=A0A7S3Y1B3_HETAK